MHFSEKSAIFKRKRKIKNKQVPLPNSLTFSNNVGWMTNFENTNQLFQSSVKTVWCSLEIFKNMKVNLE